MKKSTILWAVFILLSLPACSEHKPDSDKTQREQSEKILAEGTAMTGMPAIKNFRERKIMKMILELRDQENLLTYTYIVAEQTGKVIFMGESIGYAIPASTQYTSPQKFGWSNSHGGFPMPQADPNGLFSPASAEGSWVIMKDPGGKGVYVVYFEPRVIVSPFKLPNAQY